MSKSSGIGIGMKELLKLTLTDELSQVNHESSDKQDKIEALELQIKQLKENMNSPDVDIEGIYKDGLNKLKAGALTEALEAFSVVLYFDPSNLKALNNAGVVYFELGLEEAAAAKFRDILSIDPDNITARENLENIEENSL